MAARITHTGQGIERLDNQHELIKILLDNKIYLSPWSRDKTCPSKVLDVATGTGRWAVELGDEFPSTTVVGIDLSPIQPTLVPLNVSFFVQDASEDWEDGDGSFDYIHTRFTTGCWGDMFADIVVKAFASLQPNGWLECQELQDMAFSDDGSLTSDMPLSVWCRDLVEASKRSNRPLVAAAQLRDWFEAAGFVDIQEKVYKLPINGWPRDPRLKKLGEMWQVNMQNGLQAFSYGFMHRVLGKSKAEIEVSLVDVRKDITNPQIHAYNRFYVVWGRKPAVPTTASGSAVVVSSSSSRASMDTLIPAQ
ncbi:hypothetical protein SEUCBS139899_003575 [Sporothrix eucalyptigena]